MSEKMLTRSELKSGFIVIDIPVGIGGAVHQLYIKEHSGRDAGNTGASPSGVGVTLFVGNVDLHLDMSHEDIDGYLRELMSQFGDINAVYVSAESESSRGRKRQRKETSGVGAAAEDEDDDDDAENTQNNGIQDVHSLTTGRARFAHVQFSNKKGLASFLKVVKAGQLDFITRKVGKKWGLGEGYSGVKDTASIRKGLSFMNKSNVQELKNEVNSYMVEFEEKEAVERAAAKAREQDVDDDGFTIVKSRNTRKKSNTDGKDASTKGRKRSQKKHKGTIELKNFYRFQFREQKKETLLTLRESFAKDQEKIALLKEQRKFKPF